jgi:carbonic anhydrase
MTDCGLTHFHDEDVRKALIELDPEGEKRIKESQFGEITGLYVPLYGQGIRSTADTSCRIEESLREDVALLKASPFIRKDTQIVGLKYDIKTGVLSQVDDSKSEL